MSGNATTVLGICAVIDGAASECFCVQGKLIFSITQLIHLEFTSVTRFCFGHNDFHVKHFFILVAVKKGSCFRTVFEQDFSLEHCNGKSPLFAYLKFVLLIPEHFF